MRTTTFIVFLLSVVMISCQKEDTVKTNDSDAKLIFKYKFDPNQERLGNFGQPEDIPAGNAGQTPDFHVMGSHYIELAEKNDIPAYNGTIVTKSPTTTKGGEEAIDYDQAMYAGDGEIFFETDLKNITPGEYEYLRISLSYQNYTVDIKHNDIDLKGTVASFVGANTYIESYLVKDETVTVNDNRLQGYWALETDFPGLPVIEGQAPEGATTVPNPIFANSPIPIGSCLVTGQFDTPFVIRGDETEDIIIECSISINNSFEWKDVNSNGHFEPGLGDQVVNMGTRGLKPKVL